MACGGYASTTRTSRATLIGLLAANLIGALVGELGDRPCRVFTGDVRIRLGVVVAALNSFVLR